jgi:hypothetical protein
MKTLATFRNRCSQVNRGVGCEGELARVFLASSLVRVDHQPVNVKVAVVASSAMQVHETMRLARGLVDNVAGPQTRLHPNEATGANMSASAELRKRHVRVRLPSGDEVYRASELRESLDALRMPHVRQ